MRVRVRLRVWVWVWERVRVRVRVRVQGRGERVLSLVPRREGARPHGAACERRVRAWADGDPDPQP